MLVILDETNSSTAWVTEELAVKDKKELVGSILVKLGAHGQYAGISDEDNFFNAQRNGHARSTIRVPVETSMPFS